MSTVVIDKKEELVMRLVHYFITQKNYTPIVVTGVKNEIWLENINGPYRIIRINSNYIHNKEQYRTDLYKTKNVINQIKRKTLSFKMPTLNIFLDLNEGIDTDIDVKNISSLVIGNVNDIKKNNLIIDAFPDIQKNLTDSKGIDLIINVTNDINKKTAKENRRYEATFKPKKIVVTKIIIAICVLIYALTYVNSSILYLLANNASLVKNGEFYRLITSAFVHANIVHLICNMYSLYIIGSQIESFMGKIKFIIIFLVSAILGNLMSICFSQGFSVGASGAIFGLMGALGYFGYHYRLYLSSVIKSQIIPLIALNLVIGFMIPGIDNFAHIGGLVGGYFSLMALGVDEKTTIQERINAIIPLIILIAFFLYLGIFR